MEVILLEKIRNLGDFGKTVTVSGGYGRNFLIPKGKALPATKANVADFELRKAEFEKRSAESYSRAQERQEKLAVLDIVITARAADSKLYGSIGPKEVADVVTQMGVELSKSEVRMPLGQIRVAGEHVIGLHLHSDVTFDVTVKVIAEE
ncbi:MAG: 50S ribosomal protein L9 [Gammaproteobacteria bacterium]|nr:50S ribosomal protein L9 [Gammaproteobacteria bacterium]MCD8525540.1 50S ribosomal protein L9 [Gammaproteobacteria bacterium]